LVQQNFIKLKKAGCSFAGRLCAKQQTKYEKKKGKNPLQRGIGMIQGGTPKALVMATLHCPSENKNTEFRAFSNRTTPIEGHSAFIGLLRAGLLQQDCNCDIIDNKHGKKASQCCQ